MAMLVPVHTCYNMQVKTVQGVNYIMCSVDKKIVDRHHKWFF